MLTHPVVPDDRAGDRTTNGMATITEAASGFPSSNGHIPFAHGARFGGHALYVKDGTLKYCYNFVGEHEQIVESGEPLPTSHVVLSGLLRARG